MSRRAYFDLVGGAAGDMILAAFLDLGLELEALREAVSGLKLDGVRLRAEDTRRNGFAARRFLVEVEEKQRPARHLGDIEALIGAASTVSEEVKERACAVFRRLARAEARVHGCGIDEVHFHEVGADDALVDILGAAFAVERLGIDELRCSPFPLGGGFVDCDHGRVPLPAPAVLELLREVAAPLRPVPDGPERVTPTAAAILCELSAGFGPPPPGSLVGVGVGAGGRASNPDGSPNILRCLVLERSEDPSVEEVWVFEASIDDQSPEHLAVALERILEAGALDVSLAPLFMKKGRPGQALKVLAAPGDGPTIEAAIFRHTTTFGLRRYRVERSVLARERVSVETPYGAVRVKLGRRGDELMRASPELEDCRARARASGVSVGAVFAAALASLPDAPADDVFAE